MKAMPPKPPAEAIAACDDQLVNNSCEFKGRRNELISGICIALADRKNSSTILACRPDIEDMQPPPEDMEQQP